MSFDKFNSQVEEAKKQKEAQVPQGGDVKSDEERQGENDMKKIEVQNAWRDYENNTKLGKYDIYKRNNAMYDYSKHVAYELDPEKMGILKEPYIDTFVDNVFKLPKYIDAMLNHEIPSDSSRAGSSDMNSLDYKKYNVKSSNGSVVAISMDDIKKKYNQYESKGVPYVGFVNDMNKAIGGANRKSQENDNPNVLDLNGKYASSYFVELGSCPSKRKKQDCLNRRYYWQYDRCWKPRYGFIKNKGGSSFGKGILFSIMKSIFDLNPLEILIVTMTGKSGGGAFIAPTCDELVEDERGMEGFVGTEDININKINNLINARDMTIKLMGPIVIIAVLFLILYIANI